METPKNSDPQLLRDTISIIANTLSSYGWHVLAVIVLIAIVWNKYLSKHYHKWRESREPINSDPVVMAERVAHMEAVRRRQQQIYDKKVEEMKAKELEKQLSKRQHLEELQNSVNNSELNENQNQLKRRSAGKSLRDNSYNPLMGSSSQSTYRPTRSCGPSGG